MVVNQPLTVLLVEDNDTHALVVRRHLEKSDGELKLQHAGTLSAALEKMAENHPDIVLLDLSLPDSEITDTLPQVIKTCSDVPIIVLTSLNDLDFATTAVQQGAQDYLVKSELHGEVLLRSIRYAIERKKAHDKLESYAAELERSNDHLKSFAHTVAHEVRSPLTPIKGCIDILKVLYGDQFDSDIAKLVEASEAAIQGMSDLVSELLEFARVDSQDQRFKAVDLESVFYQVYVLLRPSVKETEARVTHDPLPKVQGNEVQLRQLFQNLIGNAIKYRGEDVPRIHVTVAEVDSVWRFSVQDNGVGIEADDQERVFDVFVRLPDTSDRPGTGIGLGFCKRIVENHGGRIWLESERKKGSTFYFELPKRNPTD